MGVPTAVAASVLTPGIFVTVDLLAGAANPGTGAINILLIAPKTSAGNLTVDTEVRAGTGLGSALTAYGAGAIGYLAARALYAKDPAATVDFCAPTAGSGAATISITATGSPAADTAVNLTIAGTLFQIPWLNGQSADTFKATAIAQINASSTTCPATASAGGTGVTTLTFKTTGKPGNDCLVQAVLNAAQTGTEALSGAATPTHLSGGTTDFDVTTVLSSASGKEYHFIVLCSSNADAQAASGTNTAKIKTQIGNNNTGLNAKLQQCIVASTGAESAAKTGAIGLNSAVFQHINMVDAQSLPGVLAAREAGARSAAIKIDPAANRIGEVIDNVVASYQPITDTPTLAGSEDALGNGVSLTGYTANLTPILIRPITTYSQDSLGAPDRRCLDVQNVDAAYIVVRDVRTMLAQTYPNAKIMKDAPAGSEPPDIPGVVEERDIKGSVINRLRFWQRQGVVDKTRLDSAIADGSLIVQVDASDETQVDVVMPFKIVKPLAKFSLYAQRFN